MKRSVKVLCTTLAFVLMMNQNVNSSASTNIDYTEEELKHSDSVKQSSILEPEENTITEYACEPYISRDEVSKEYREMDENAATILGNYLGKEYYDYTISFEKSDRIAAMHKMLEVYDQMNLEEQNTILSYMSSYAPYTEDDTLINSCEELQSADIIKASASTYDRSAAATWAINNYSSYNSNYPDCRDLGGDCANFVSQCMHVGGGMAMQDDWYCYRKNTTYLKPKTVDQLNYTWTLADPSPWISAKEFKNFWSSSSRSTTYTYTKSDYTSSSSPAYSASIYKGHAMSFCYSKLWWYEAAHTVLIVDYDSSNKDYIYAAHSSAKKDGKVKTGISNYDAVVFYAFN